MEGVRAVVIGGTGACGSHLVATLLKSKVQSISGYVVASECDQSLCVMNRSQ